MSFEIKIYYVTGDSFGSHEETERLGPIFEDLEQARVAARRIREHYN
jgi:hypothetical protein